MAPQTGTLKPAAAYGSDPRFTGACGVPATLKVAPADSSNKLRPRARAEADTRDQINKSGLVEFEAPVHQHIDGGPVTQGGSKQVATTLSPKEVLSSALLESLEEILTHYGQTPQSIPTPRSIPTEASIGASMQFGNQHLSVGVTLLSTPSFLQATLPYHPDQSRLKVELRDWALELCNQLTGSLRGRLQRYGINARPGLPHTDYNYGAGRLERTDDTVYAFDSEAGLSFIKLTSWIDPTLTVPMRPSLIPSLSPGDLKLF